MELTTLCYIEQDEKYLMLHRVSKKNDPNKGKWIGVGGHFEEYESPEECLLREVKEETGLTLENYVYRGIVTFVSDEWETNYMHLYTADRFSGTMHSCDEGELRWIDKKDIMNLNLWEGDKVFLKELLNKESNRFFSLKLQYVKDKLVNTTVKYY